MSEQRCDYPECDQPASVLLANDEPLLSPEYAERLVCRWHQRNAFPRRSSSRPPSDPQARGYGSGVRPPT